jgi:crotonobetainyl-CoA:carnitine CoA-transferase CaiB-like acyl-CoA transferase
MVTGALEGTVCIDVSGHVAGPYAGSLLGDLGCEVIKVELPDGGDTHRGRNPKYEGYGPSFRVLNRNKKSVTLNLKSERGRQMFEGLVMTLLAGAGVPCGAVLDSGEVMSNEHLRGRGMIVDVEHPRARADAHPGQPPSASRPRRPR